MLVRLPWFHMTCGQLTNIALFVQIIMFCLKEPDSFCGGETVLLKNRDLTATIDPEVIRKFEEKKVRYQAFLPNKTTDAGLQKSWQDRFWLEDPQVCINWFYYVKTDEISNFRPKILLSQKRCIVSTSNPWVSEDDEISGKNVTSSHIKMT